MALFELPAVPADQWLTLYDAVGERPAVRVRMLPIGPSALRAARDSLVSAGHPIEAYVRDAGLDAFSRELCRRGMVEWEGIGRDGAPAEIDAAGMDALLADAGFLARLQGLYVFPFLDREAEKNGSSLSSAGTSPAMTGAKDTAAVAPAPAKPARTRSTPRKPRKAKPSGR